MGDDVHFVCCLVAFVVVVVVFVHADVVVSTEATATAAAAAVTNGIRVATVANRTSNSVK